MVTSKERNDLSLRVPMTTDEQAQFKNYIEEHSLHQGRFVRKIILDAISRTSERGEVQEDS